MKNGPIAMELVMQDLLDCLLAESFFGPLTLVNAQEWLAQQSDLILDQYAAFKQPIEGSKIWQWHYDKVEQRSILVLLKAGITQAWERVPNSPVLLLQENQSQALTPEAFLRHALEGVKSRYQGNEKGLALFQETLALSVRQTALSLDHHVTSQNLLAKENGDFFRAMEQWASLRDRPYHPLAKAKLGLSDEEFVAYQAEFANTIVLNWVAVRKDWLQVGDGVDSTPEQQPAKYVLTNTQLASLNAEMQRLGLAKTHLPLPVHPWQFEHILQKQLDDAFAAGDCQRLTFVSEGFFASSSLRSMMSTVTPANHVKLPMAVYSLGASRYLPAVKMVNGGYSEALLKQVKQKDEVLSQRLFLCDEGVWWAYMPPNGSLFDEAPRHLSAMIRQYPKALLNNPNTRLMPMAALGTPLGGSQEHFFDEWLSYRQLAPTGESVVSLFRELSASFFDINLRMFRQGMLGEVHGQNAVLVWHDGYAQGLLLRDHDSLRIYVPWLEENGMQDPNYCIKPGHANTLYHDSPEGLLFWLQTLGIQVNMRSIIETLAYCYSLDKAQLWRVMGEEIRRCIELIDFSKNMRNMLCHELFERATWPQKYLLSPMIDRAGGPGSMPFDKGEVVNPFQQLSR